MSKVSEYYDYQDTKTKGITYRYEVQLWEDEDGAGPVVALLDMDDSSERIAVPAAILRRALAQIDSRPEFNV